MREKLGDYPHIVSSDFEAMQKLCLETAKGNENSLEKELKEAQDKINERYEKLYRWSKEAKLQQQQQQKKGARPSNCLSF